MTSWTCEELDRWLDDGRPEENRGRGEAHAGVCARCHGALAAAVAVERALVLPELASRAPADFTDGVMRRISVAGRRDARPAAPSLVGSLLADPAAATACVLAIMVIWWREPLWALAVTISARAVALVSAPFELVRPVAFDALTSPAAFTGLAVAVLPLVAWGSWSLLRWAERATARTLDGFPVRPLDSLVSPPSTS